MRRRRTPRAGIHRRCRGAPRLRGRRLAAGCGDVEARRPRRPAPLAPRCPFATIRTPAGAGRAKPAPDPILLALVDLGADPAAAMYVGDMAVDQESAARAGVAYVHAEWGYGQPASPAPEVAGSPKELLQLLRSHEPFIEGSLS
ncbi:HAD hydrolase-like protein [Streptomyces sp. TRM68367]|uniref:HAD family hydrolase n=1 Tax=Streptomyces sp. TRM68367 TaxID=2758415 RepID=UPI0029343B7E|nr:HAD hydrolase-like protein [Streptomyces sp. TRM68367]